MCDICKALGQVVLDTGEIVQIGPADEAEAFRLMLERGSVEWVPVGPGGPPKGGRARRRRRRGPGRAGGPHRGQ